MQSPWYCIEARFFDDPRCRFMYHLKWHYNKEKSELEITTDYTRNSDSEVVLLGLLHRADVK